ncbi:MAG: ThuA domain-containing protein [Acidobacteria bacterium]|nr:ThuA domain-containing protein [Acidobacteriota bacterium]
MIAASALLLFASAFAPKHIVLVAADQEYRSEESMPALARILEQKHGFRCTVLYPIDPKSGEIHASVPNNVPGLEALRTADLMILFARMVELPDAQMKEIIDYTNSGRPLVALRTSTHPFQYKLHPESPYAKYSYNNKEFAGGYGRQVLGETWIRHWGAHQKQSTRGVPVPAMRKHPILKGVKDVWGPSDVYEITTLSGDSQPLVMGEVLNGMLPDSPPDTSKRTMPVAWIKTYTGGQGKPARIFTTTMGHCGDFLNEGFRRMVINATYWGLGMEKRIKPGADVGLTGPYNPNPIGFGKHKTGLMP